MLSPALIAAVPPLALALAALAPSRRPRRHADRLFHASLVAFAAAVAAAVLAALHGPLATGTLGVAGIGASLTIDALSAIMLLLISFVGAVVIRYSRAYLDGDPGHHRFMTWLGLTLASVLLLVVSGNLFLLALAWTGTSIGLHRLLLFYPHRVAAVLAARKKFIVSRIGDLCLVGAMALLWTSIGSLDIGVIRDAARAAGPDVPLAFHAAAGLLVLAALLKSAQLPVHGWLLEVMETPTPVSALLHAGIINAGGFLVLRFADLIALSAPSMGLLTLVGGVTALLASVVMLTQTSIKLALAWSTIAQMGFMLLQCGLGAFPAALLHIVAHSLYKAHAFLSSGSVIDIARASWSPSPSGRPHAARLGLAIGIVLAATLVAGTLAGVQFSDQPGVYVLGAVVLLGLTHLLAAGIDERFSAYVLGRTALAATAVALLYFALQAGIAWLTAGVFPAAVHGAFGLGLAAVIIMAFAAITFFQGWLPSQRLEPWAQALWVHVSNGFYLNTHANRMVLRLWPARNPQHGA